LKRKIWKHLLKYFLPYRYVHCTYYHHHHHHHCHHHHHHCHHHDHHHDHHCHQHCRHHHCHYMSIILYVIIIIVIKVVLGDQPTLFGTKSLNACNDFSIRTSIPLVLLHLQNMVLLLLGIFYQKEHYETFFVR